MAFIYMVKEGLGISILPRLSLGEEKDVDVVELNPGFGRIIVLAYRDGDFAEKLELRRFVEYIKMFGIEQLDL